MDTLYVVRRQGVHGEFPCFGAHRCGCPFWAHVESSVKEQTYALPDGNVITVSSEWVR